jgi:hypothetical protein
MKGVTMQMKKAIGSWFVTLMLTFSVVAGVLTYSNHLRASGTTTSAAAATTATTTAPVSSATTPTTIVFHTGDDGTFTTTGARYHDN